MDTARPACVSAWTNRSQEFTRVHVPTTELTGAVLVEGAAVAGGRDFPDVCATPVLLPELQPAAIMASARRAGAMARLIKFPFLPRRPATDTANDHEHAPFSRSQDPCKAVAEP